MELNHAGDVCKKAVGGGDDLVGRARLRRVGPENDDVRKHGFIEQQRREDAKRKFYSESEIEISKAVAACRAISGFNRFAPLRLCC
jgi:hypothetical protein